MDHYITFLIFCKLLIYLFRDVLQAVRLIFQPRRNLAGQRLFLVAMAGDQGFARAFEQGPTRLL